MGSEEADRRLMHKAMSYVRWGCGIEGLRCKEVEGSMPLHLEKEVDQPSDCRRILDTTNQLDERLLGQ